ncbi:MAG TPA: endolytic transglycosylase MltG [Chitinophagaceae bacterium]|nr:endolytic transglycosylase MltG [Chitinophagaceae bacterium]
MKRKFLFGIIAVLLFAIVFIAWKFMGPAVSTPSGEFFYIKTGSTYADVKDNLIRQKFIGGATWFNWTSTILKYEKIKPGRYKLSKGMSIVELVRMLRNGNQARVNFVITKIRTKETLASRVGQYFECDSADMIRFLNSPDSLRPFGFDSNTVMASALPLTYTLNWNMTAGKIFRQWHTAYKNFWTEERIQKAAQKGLSPVEATTLASIIEEETNKKSDKPNIASVYLNRIKKGMPLQADPTVKFALKNFALKRILRGHLQSTSPYNTYRNTGLPPGPICTPSEETVEAVLDAPSTEYLYFVASSNFDGTHVFTTNYEDHLKYARLYQQELTTQMKIRDSLQALQSK